MQILCLGLNHTTAPLDLREKLAFGEEQVRSVLVRGKGEARERVLLSTCNRLELYTVSPQDGDACYEGDEALETWWLEGRGLSVGELRRHGYRYTGEAAVRHLHRVAAGLDSLVIGEPQILGQVTRALELALEAGACGGVLSRLFRSAIHAGKRARSETAISRNATSVSSLAALLAAQEVAHLPDARILMIGAGEMAELAVESLRNRGARHIVVLNRTLERARSLAERWGARAVAFEELDAFLLHADIVISSTSAPHTILDAAHVREIMPQRAGRGVVMVDIAVPRDIDPDVGCIPGVKLFDIDTLEQQAAHLRAERAAEVPRVESILAEEQSQFMEYLNGLEMMPVITELRRQAEAIRQNELEKTLRRLPGLTDVERERIEAMTRALVKKLLETPTQRLRVEATCSQASQFASVVRTLFDLPDEAGLYALPPRPGRGVMNPNPSSNPPTSPYGS